jgi:hypothetical protein
VAPDENVGAGLPPNEAASAATAPIDSGDHIALDINQLISETRAVGPTNASAPPPVRNLADTGLSEIFIRGIILKVMHGYGSQTPAEIAKIVKLPVAVVREALELMRIKGMLESLGAEARTRQFDLRYSLSGIGREWAQDALRQSLYTGPAPVPVAQWQAQVKRQSITNDRVDQSAIAESLKGLVISRDLIARFGPAVNAGRGILLYGAPGDGKTSIAQAIARSFRQPIWVPYAIEVDGEIVKFFDPAIHREMPDETDTAETAARTVVSATDRRWVRCERPVMIVGGRAHDGHARAQVRSDQSFLRGAASHQGDRRSSGRRRFRSSDREAGAGAQSLGPASREQD